MRLLNILWQKRSNLTVLLLTIIAIIPAIPILKLGTYGVFYNIDPEMALIGNALSLIKDGMIHYGDHPGTPSIIMISLSYLPIRIYTKLFEHVNFITWSFDNLKYLFLYTRIVYILVFITSLYILLSSIRKFSNNVFVPLFSLFFIFIFSFTPRLLGAILSESLSFLLISVWLFLFISSIRKLTMPKVCLLAFIGGLAIANKYNSFPIFLVTLLFPFFIKNKKPIEILKNIFISSLTGISGFIIGTWKIKSFYFPLVRNISKVFFQSGSAHGNGELNFLNIESYRNSLKIFYQVEKTIALVIVVISIVFITLFVLAKELKIKFELTIFFLFGVTLISMLFIAKYPVSYYQFPNIVIITFCTSYLVGKLPKSFALIACLLITIPFVNNLKAYNQHLINSINNSAYLEQYVYDHRTNKPTLWDFGMTEDFMRIWIRGWAQGVYDNELMEKRPDLLELKSDYKTVYLDFNHSSDIFNVCWDKLYIRENRALVFQDLYKTKKFKTVSIGNTGIWEVKSDHCSTMP